MNNKTIIKNEILESKTIQIKNLVDLNNFFEIKGYMFNEKRSRRELSNMLDFSKGISIGGADFEPIYNEFSENRLNIFAGRLKREEQFVFYIFDENNNLVSKDTGVGSDYLFKYVYDSLSKKIKNGKTICNEDYSMAISQIIEEGDELIVGANTYKLLFDDEFDEFYIEEKGGNRCIKKSSDILEVMDDVVSKHNNEVISIIKKAV